MISASRIIAVSFGVLASIPLNPAFISQGYGSGVNKKADSLGRIAICLQNRMKYLEVIYL
jgi:hypothetical protein